MTNSKSNIEIATVANTTILLISEQPISGGGINETKEENTIYEANIVYEF